MEENIIIIVLGLFVAVCGAWETSKQRHHMTVSQRRRKTD